MYPLGHVGFGTWAVQKIDRKKSLPWKPIALGTLLPDLLDKPLYHGLSYFMGSHGNDLGLISGTRTFGHTLLAAILLVFLIQKKKVAMALAAGMVSHLVLDAGFDWVLRQTAEFTPEILLAIEKSPKFYTAVFFPAFGFEFPDFYWPSSKAYLVRSVPWAVWVSECLGLALICWKYIQSNAKKSKAVR